jgi:hypothetical protein
VIRSLLVVVACAAAAQTLSRDVTARPVPRTVLVVSVGEAGSGAFVADAEVRLPSVRRTVRTKWDGEARFDGLDAGSYHVQVRAVGFAPGDIDIQVRGDSLGLHFDLERIPTALDTVVVVDEAKRNLHMEPFETRRREGIGRFLTREQLLDDRTQSLQMVLTTRFAGLQVKERGIISRQPSGISRDNECPVLIYLDGMQLESVKTAAPKLADPRAGAGGGRGRGENIAGTGASADDRRIADLEIIRPAELAGVEVYTRTTAPQQYRPLGNYCSVVLLWTYFPRSRP